MESISYESFEIKDKYKCKNCKNSFKDLKTLEEHKKKKDKFILLKLIKKIYE